MSRIYRCFAVNEPVGYNNVSSANSNAPRDSPHTPYAVSILSMSSFLYIRNGGFELSTEKLTQVFWMPINTLPHCHLNVTPIWR